ncbi:hypothetical protein HC928_18305 [bacterium]|nr:hypothetical protein [bacterium]
MYQTALTSPQWGHYHFSSYDNPFIDPAIIDIIRTTTPEQIFEQEYFAAFVEGGGSVFQNVSRSLTATVQEIPVANHDYIAGIDLAKHHDFSVITIIDADIQEVVYIERFNQINYIDQIDIFVDILNRFKCVATVVETNSNEAVIELLSERNIDVLPFRTTAQSKRSIIEDLQVALSTLQLYLPSPDHGSPYTDLIRELVDFEVSPRSNGLHYSAPAGKHDDMVMSLALAYYGVKRGML